MACPTAGQSDRLMNAMADWKRLSNDPRLTPLRTARDSRLAHSLSPQWTSCGPWLTPEIAIDLATEIFALVENLIEGSTGPSGLKVSASLSAEWANSYLTRLEK